MTVPDSYRLDEAIARRRAEISKQKVGRAWLQNVGSPLALLAALAWIAATPPQKVSNVGETTGVSDQKTESNPPVGTYGWGSAYPRPPFVIEENSLEKDLAQFAKNFLTALDREPELKNMFTSEWGMDMSKDVVGAFFIVAHQKSLNVSTPETIHALMTNKPIILEVFSGNTPIGPLNPEQIGSIKRMYMATLLRSNI